MRIKKQEVLCGAEELHLQGDLLIRTETTATWVMSRLLLTWPSARRADKTDEAARTPSWRRRHAQAFTRFTENLVCLSAYKPLTVEPEGLPASHQL